MVPGFGFGIGSSFPLVLLVRVAIWRTVVPLALTETWHCKLLSGRFAMLAINGMSAERYSCQDLIIKINCYARRLVCVCVWHLNVRAIGVNVLPTDAEKGIEKCLH